MVKLYEATITRQGQISIPKKIRNKLHLQPGAKIAFLEDEKGQIVIQEVEPAFELTRSQWDEFLAKAQKETVTRVKGKTQALGHLDRLMKKSGH